MKKFQFKLSNVLKVRQREEEKAQQELHAAQLVVDKLRALANEMKAEEKALLTELNQMQKGSLSVQQYSASLAYHSQLLQSIAYKEDEVLKAMNEVSKKRELLKAKTQEKKVLEKLKEKQLREWEKEMLREESAQLDEIATIRYERSFE